MKRRVRVFTLPGEEYEVDKVLNEDLITIIDELKVPCPKEGIILLYLKYEDYREEAL
jgi:hypothetical protein